MKLLLVALVLGLAYLFTALVREAPQGADRSAQRVQPLAIPPLAARWPAQARDETSRMPVSGVTGRDRAPGRAPSPGASDAALDLVLRGTFSSTDSRLAHAIVADRSGNEEHYRVGDSMPGGILVHEIMPDRVVVLRNGRYETLPLVRDDAEGGVRLQARSGPAGGPGAGSDPGPVFVQQPKSLIDLVQPQPVRSDGRFIGFRLRPRSNHHPLQEFGFQQDDVVTWVNEVNLDNPLKGVRALSSISGGDYVNMTVRRAGQDFSLSFHVPQEFR
ncbi:MAG: type II secretion system protein N [Gammaproteobacteria bacterium]